MPGVQAYHQIVADVKHDWDVGDKLLVVPRQALRQLDLDELVEFFGALTSVRATVDKTKEHEPWHIDSTLGKRLIFFTLLVLLVQKRLIEHELAGQTALLLDVQERPMVLKALLNDFDSGHVLLSRRDHLL